MLKPYFYQLSPESISGHELDQLLALGWYRMHQDIFTCSHIGVDAPYRVHWLRYDLKEIRSHASHHRIRNRNKHFQFVIEPLTAIRSDHSVLHRKYRSVIDFDGALSIEDCLFGGEETANIFNTKCITVFDGDRVIAGGYFDAGDQAVASILHFYDPAYSKFSLGKYLILLTLDYMRAHHYEYYYPGYVVTGQRKMDYKLFLGKKEAQYFDPLTVSWKYFDESILAGNSQPAG